MGSLISIMISMLTNKPKFPLPLNSTLLKLSLLQVMHIGLGGKNLILHFEQNVPMIFLFDNSFLYEAINFYSFTNIFNL